MRLIGASIAGLALLSSFADASESDSSSQVQEKRDTTTSVREIVHNGSLFTEDDIARAKAAIEDNIYPYNVTYNGLKSSKYGNVDYSPGAVVGIIRGATSWAPVENYSVMFRDAAAAYQLALLWTVTGDSAYGDAAVRVLYAWGSTLEWILGSSDKYLASGIYGYEFAIAAELIRDYEGFNSTHKEAVTSMFENIFYPMNVNFLTNHIYDGNGTHYWANWDLCNIASAMSIAIFTDNTTKYEYALTYMKEGGGTGSFPHLFPYVFSPEEANNTFGLAELQESARDQGHAGLDLALVQVIAQLATLQGDDLWSYDDHVILKGAEYYAQYNLGYDVPFVAYVAQYTNMTGISPASRGNYRPIWSLFYSKAQEYGLETTYINELYEDHQIEYGGGSYGSNSGGFDQLGFGTLAYLTTPVTFE